MSLFEANLLAKTRLNQYKIWPRKSTKPRKAKKANLKVLRRKEWSILKMKPLCWKKSYLRIATWTKRWMSCWNLRISQSISVSQKDFLMLNQVKKWLHKKLKNLKRASKLRVVPCSTRLTNWALFTNSQLLWDKTACASKPCLLSLQEQKKFKSSLTNKIAEMALSLKWEPQNLWVKKANEWWSQWAF